MKASHHRSRLELGYLDKQKSAMNGKIPMKHNKEPRKQQEIPTGGKRNFLQQHSIGTGGSAATGAVS